MKHVTETVHQAGLSLMQHKGSLEGGEGEEGGGGSKDLLPLTTPLRTPSSSWTQSEARLNGHITVKELGYEVFIPG